MHKASHIATMRLSCVPSDWLINLAACYSQEHGCILLHSGGSFDTARKSMLWLFPLESIALFKDGSTEVFQRGGFTHFPPEKKSAWQCLKQFMSTSGKESFWNGDWAGWLGYSLGDDHSTLDMQKSKKKPFLDIPEAYFQRSLLYLELDLHTKSLIIQIDCCQRAFLRLDQLQMLRKLLKDPRSFLKCAASRIKKRRFLKRAPLCIKRFERLDDYCSSIDAIQEKIRQGEVYQVSLSQECIIQGSFHPFQLFRKLNRVGPTPFSAYLRYHDLSVVSLSPERFLKHEKGLLETRPIKGTKPRGANQKEDGRLFKELQDSEKETSELAMITDLMRSDMGKVSRPGSVKVKEFARIETYHSVFQRLSIIQSIVQPDLHPLDLLEKMFPGGSVTGCPKKMALQVIEKHEKHYRGIYTGCIGYFKKCGDFDLSIAIRTIVMNNHYAEIKLGGGIVIDSKGIDEYLETLFKGLVFFQCLGVNLLDLCPEDARLSDAF